MIRTASGSQQRKCLERAARAGVVIMGRLDGRVAIVTGAGRGIGAAIAHQLAAEGAAIVVADLGAALDGSGRDAGPAAQVVKQIEATGGIATASAIDVSDHHAVEALVGSTIKSFGRLDIVINAAGILRDRMIFNLSEEDWDTVIRVHLKGCFNTSKFASIYWREKKEGNYRLINFTSIAGLNGNPGQPNYAAAKMGIVGLTWSCANALAKYGATANCISPGAATRMVDAIPPEMMKKYIESGDAAARVPVDDPRRAPESMVPGIVYLASKESGWLNGQIIGLQEYRISLWNKPAIQRQIVSPGPWKLEDLFEEIPRAFKSTVEGRRDLSEAG
jgi:NAD(P)-dependent dehydrogenase (short-subunit alcohol dehydrogenase family)